MEIIQISWLNGPEVGNMELGPETKCGPVASGGALSGYYRQLSTFEFKCQMPRVWGIRKQLVCGTRGSKEVKGKKKLSCNEGDTGVISIQLKLHERHMFKGKGSSWQERECGWHHGKGTTI